MVQQLTIFDALPKVKVKGFEIGDVVEVVPTTDESDVETYFYLRGYEGLRGRVTKVIREPDLQYEVQYDKKERVGIFRHDELKGASDGEKY